MWTLCTSATSHFVTNISLLEWSNWEWDGYGMHNTRKAVLSELQGKDNLGNLGLDGQTIWQCIKKIWYKNMYWTNVAEDEIQPSQGDELPKLKGWGMSWHAGQQAAPHGLCCMDFIMKSSLKTQQWIFLSCFLSMKEKTLYHHVGVWDSFVFWTWSWIFTKFRTYARSL
jgi:hypothetical protein